MGAKNKTAHSQHGNVRPKLTSNWGILLKSRSTLIAPDIKRSACRSSPRWSTPAGASGIWRETACFSVADGPGASPPAHPPGGRRHSSLTHALGYANKNSWCGRGRKGSNLL